MHGEVEKSERKSTGNQKQNKTKQYIQSKNKQKSNLND